MLLKVAIIVLIIYIIVVTRSRIRLPNPALQATVDVLQAATLKDEHVMQMARKYIDYADAQNALLAESTLMSFTAGFKLAWGMVKELETDGLYSFEQEEEEHICHPAEQDI